ncbi:RNA-directed DNA polymerase, eukaryota [Tanacetum coccineum]
MENFSVIEAKYIWGNSNFAYLFSDSIGNFGGIVCMWESHIFLKDCHTVSNNFIAVYGTWMPIKSKILIIAIYSPQSVTEKRTLWQYITHLIHHWNGECIVMGDFNEVRSEDERLGSSFNVSGANEFNAFIANSGLIDLHLEGYSFTWSHPSAQKMNARDNLQKAKVKWAVEGDENTKYFHGIINKKRANLSIRGVMVDGEWIVKPMHVKEAFRNHFASRFQHPSSGRSHINFTFPNRLSQEQKEDLESHVSMDEIRKAVWDCGENKSPGYAKEQPEGGVRSRVRAWEDTLCKLKLCLSKRKSKTLSIGGRLTLLKAVLGATLIYAMSLYKVPKTVLNLMESIQIQLDNKLHFVEEPVEIMDREVKRLKQSRIPIVKVRWNSRRGPEFTWEREDFFRSKYPHLFARRRVTRHDKRRDVAS